MLLRVEIDHPIPLLRATPAVRLVTASAEERAAFLLREVFDYPHERTAAILGKSPAAVRQLAVRARRHVGAREPRFETSLEQRDRLASRFFDAFEDGNLESLEALLAADVSLHGDGGGKVQALARALHGRARVARAMLGFRRNCEATGQSPAPSGAKLPCHVPRWAGRLLAGRRRR
jgi:hypothetical protein